MNLDSPRLMRRAYLQWVEEQVETFKETIPRGELLAIADEVVRELRVTQGGQYQLTELLLCQAMDRHLFQRLKLPGYRAWVAQQKAAAASLIPADLKVPEPHMVPVLRIAPAPARAAESLACVV